VYCFAYAKTIGQKYNTSRVVAQYHLRGANHLTLFVTANIIRSMIFTSFHTRMGWVALLADDQALLGLALPRATRRAALDELRVEFHCQPPRGENDITRLAQQKIERYFHGERVTFDGIPIDGFKATDFQRSVWRLTRAIPYGTTRTYDSLARAVGRPHAARAVGQCMARNPLPIIIPCHRVVGSGGDLRGFGGGLAMKQALLEMEGAL
jgi:O-6-methylguanine DNA methyltransferase